MLTEQPVTLLGVEVGVVDATVQVDHQVEPILGTGRTGALHRRPIGHQDAQAALQQRFHRLAHHPGQQRFDPGDAGLQAVMDCRIADPLLQQREVSRRFPQHRVNAALIHHPLH